MRLKYIICTVDNTYNIPLVRLLESMLIHNINPDDILLSIQSEQHLFPVIKKKIIQVGNSIYQFNSVYNHKKIYEYSFFTSCKILLDSSIISSKDRYIMLHDTCIALSSHVKKMDDIINSNFFNKFDMIFADNIGRHNIGIYDYNSILLGNQIWKNITSVSKQFAIDIEHNRPGTEKYNIKSNNELKQYRYDIGINDTAIAYIYNYQNIRTVSSLIFFGIDKFFYYVDPSRPHPDKP